MRPCCLKAWVVTGQAACHSENRLGGVTRYVEGACPATAEQADILIKSGAAQFLDAPHAPPMQAAQTTSSSKTDAGGCCYSVGFGTDNLPCCLKSHIVDNLTGCELTPRLGGRTGFRHGRCPEDPAEAAAWTAVAMPAEGTLTGTLMESRPKGGTLQSSELNGCCYSIGFGSFMRPCCLRTAEAADETQCGTSRRLVGGSMGFSAAGCPRSAQEAATWLEAKHTSVGSENLLGAIPQGTGPQSATAPGEEGDDDSSDTMWVLGTLALLVSGLVIAFASLQRRPPRRPNSLLDPGLE